MRRPDLRRQPGRKLNQQELRGPGRTARLAGRTRQLHHRQNQPLTTKGLNPATIKGNLEGVKSDLSAKKNDRDAKKAALKEAQQAFETSASTNYRTFSDAVDTVSGAMGKQTPQGQQVLNYRKNVTGSNCKPGDTGTPAAKTTPA